MPPNVIIRPEREYKVYRLRAAFDLAPFPSEKQLRLMKLKAGYLFMRDMQKQGWEYMGRGLGLSGPRPMPEMKFAATRRVQNQHKPSDFFFDLPPMDALNTMPVWRYFLTGLFVRREIHIERSNDNGTEP